MSIETFSQELAPKPRTPSKIRTFGRTLLGVASMGVASEYHLIYKAHNYESDLVTKKRRAQIQTRATNLMTANPTIATEAALERSSVEQFCADKAWLPLDPKHSKLMRLKLKLCGFLIESTQLSPFHFVAFPEGWSLQPNDDVMNMHDVSILDPAGNPRFAINYIDSPHNPLHNVSPQAGNSVAA